MKKLIRKNKGNKDKKGKETDDDIMKKNLPTRNLAQSGVREEWYVDNMIYYNYQKEKLMIYNKRRLQHWMSVFTNILGTV